MSSLLFGQQLFLMVLLAVVPVIAEEDYPPALPAPDGCEIRDDIPWHPENHVGRWEGVMLPFCGMAVLPEGATEWSVFFPNEIPAMISMENENYALIMEVHEDSGLHRFSADVTGRSLVRGVSYIGTQQATPTPTPMPIVEPPMPFNQNYRLALPLMISDENHQP